MIADLAARVRAALDTWERLVAEYEAYMGERAVAAGSYVLVTPPGWGPGEPFDPDTVRRLVAAMREIVDLHHSEPASGFDADGWEHHGHGCAVCYFADAYPCLTIHALARGLGIDPEETDG